jgi:hypothetical protein
LLDKSKNVSADVLHLDSNDPYIHTTSITPVPLFNYLVHQIKGLHIWICVESRFIVKSYLIIHLVHRPDEEKSWNPKNKIVDYRKSGIEKL